MIEYSVINPGKSLTAYIDNYFVVGGETVTHKEVPPRLGSSLIFDFNNNTKINKSTYKVALIGTRQIPYSLRTTNENDRLIVHFSSFGLSVFGNSTVQKLSNRIVNAEDFFDDGILSLYQELRRSTPEKRVDLLETFLLSRYKFPQPTEHLIFALASMLSKDAGTSMRNIKNAAPFGLRQLQRKFKDKTGLSISHYKIMARFGKAVELLKEDSLAKLTQVALEAGYYDQSHFNSDIKSLTSRSPGQLIFC